MDRPIKTTSALAGVFGSAVSLAELAGDDSADYQTVASARQAAAYNYPANGGSSASSSSFSLDSTADGHKLNGSGVPYGRRASRGQHTHGRTSSTHSVQIPGFASTKKVVKLSPISLLTRLVTLFIFGVAYGQISLHLHDNHEANQAIFGSGELLSSSLFAVWGCQGMAIGVLFPLFDAAFPEKSRRLARGKGGHDWTSIVRALAAFVGVSYGIRKFSWTSTVQSAFYWGMVNPCLWYILDATRNGFILSSLVAILGAALFAGLFPSHFPAAHLASSYISVVAWVASVFFCCSICIGNLGRRILRVVST